MIEQQNELHRSQRFDLPIRTQRKISNIHYRQNTPYDMYQERHNNIDVSFDAMRIHYNTEHPIVQKMPIQFARNKKSAKQKQPVHTTFVQKEDGAQEFVQKRIKEIYKKRYGKPSGAEEVWLEECIDPTNGLCGGWAALHRADPKCFTEIWMALASWDVEDDLTEHMNRNTSIQEPEIGWEDFIITLADDAVGIMEILEPSAGYRMLPNHIPNQIPKFEPDAIPMNPNKKLSIRVEDTGAGEKVYNAIISSEFLKNKKNDPHIIHIETDYHHMSVRTRYINRMVRIEEIVETEYAGVVVPRNSSEAKRILENGIYLSENRAQSICLNFYNKV